MYVVDGTIEWLKDEATGVPVGFKKKDGTEGGLVTVDVNPVTGGITKIWSGSQAEYDAIAVKADDTLYVIV